MLRNISKSSSYAYLKSQITGKFKFQKEKEMTHSKSQSFFSNCNDFNYLTSKNLKQVQEISYKIPFFGIQHKNNSIKKSYSCDSLKNIQFTKQNDRTKQIKLINSTNDNMSKTLNILIKRSPSYLDLHSLTNDNHSIYIIHGHVLCYMRIFSQIDYNQHIDKHDLSNSDLTDFFNRDERVNERELLYIEKRKVRYFTRQKKQTKKKKNKTNDSPSDSQKEKPRFYLYFPKDSSPLTKRAYSRPQPPKPSSASVLNSKYNIRTRLFKENNIRHFYQELAIAEEDDKHFIFNPKDNKESPKNKRSRSAERIINNSSQFQINKKQRSKSVQYSPNKFIVFKASPVSRKGRPRFNLYSPPQSAKKTDNESQRPKFSPAFILNEKYNIRTRLFKEKNIHDFYQNLAEAEEEVKIKKSLEQIRMSPNSRKIVEKYFQRTNQQSQIKPKNDKNSQSSENGSQIDKKEENSTEKETGKSTDSHNESENDKLGQISDKNINYSSSPERKSNKQNKNVDYSSSSHTKNRNQNEIVKKDIRNLNESIENKNKNDQHFNQSPNSCKTRNVDEVEPNESEKRSLNENDGNDNKSKDDEQIFEMKKFYHKTPGFVSGVSSFLKKYSIIARNEYSAPEPKSKPVQKSKQMQKSKSKTKKKKSHT